MTQYDSFKTHDNRQLEHVCSCHVNTHKTHTGGAEPIMNQYDT